MASRDVADNRSVSSAGRRRWVGPVQTLEVQTRLILNKITMKTFEVLMNKLILLIDDTVTTEAMIQMVVKKILHVAQEQHQLGALYAQMCRILHSNQQTTLRRLTQSILVRTSQDYFDELFAAQEQGEKINKRSYIGNIRFMGHMHNVGLIDWDAIQTKVLRRLLKYGEDRIPTAVDIESTCQLFTIIGKTLDGENSEFLDSYMELLPVLASLNGSFRMQCIVLNLTDLRSNEWVDNW